MKTCVSLWSADLVNLAADIRRAEACADEFHLDVSDGYYAPLLLFFPDLVAAIRRQTKLPLEVHLIVQHADRWIEPFVAAGADIITFYPDATDDMAASVQDIRGRGKRIEEQIAVLRRLWSEPYVTLEGRYHTLDKVGLNRVAIPPIPIWMGSESGETALRRVARLADGWMSLGDPLPDIPRLQQYMREAGRDPSTLKVRGPLVVDDDLKGTIERGRKLAAGGVSHINIVAPPDRDPRAALPTIVATRKALAETLG